MKAAGRRAASGRRVPQKADWTAREKKGHRLQSGGKGRTAREEEKKMAAGQKGENSVKKPFPCSAGRGGRRGKLGKPRRSELMHK